MIVVGAVVAAGIVAAGLIMVWSLHVKSALRRRFEREHHRNKIRR